MQPANLLTADTLAATELTSLAEGCRVLQGWTANNPAPRGLVFVLHRFQELLTYAEAKLRAETDGFAHRKLSRQIARASAIQTVALRLAANPDQMLNACGAGLTEVVKQLAAAGQSVVVRDANGFTSLHYAVRSQKVSLVTFLCQQNYPLGLADSSGQTALHWAVSNRKARMVALLVMAGAPINALNKAGNTPLRELCFEHQRSADSDRTARIALGLILSGADPVAGQSPIRWCHPMTLIGRRKMLAAWSKFEIAAAQQGPLTTLLGDPNLRRLFWTKLPVDSLLAMRRTCKLYCNAIYSERLLPAIQDFYK